MKDSTFISTRPESYSYPRDNCAVMINVGGSLDINNCTIIGERQGVIVRAGTATITGSTITTLGTYTNKEEYYNSSWGSGNNVPAAALVVGSHNGTYNYDASCTLTNTSVKANNDFATIYMDSNATYSSSLNFSGTGNVSTSLITAGQYMENVTVNGNAWSSITSTSAQ